MKGTLRHSSENIAVWGMIVVVCLVYAVYLYPFIIDDAYITFAYAKTFTHTGELRLREGMRVEATSSLLWALMLGCFSKVALQVTVWSKVLGFVLSVAAVRIAVEIVHARTPCSSCLTNRLLVALAGSVTFAFGLWSNYGMENSLVCTLALLMALCLPRESKTNMLLLIPLVTLALYASRPEGFGYVSALVGAEIVRRIATSQLSRWFLIGLAISVILVTGYEIFGFLYYGTWLPDSALQDRRISARPTARGSSVQRSPG